MNNIITSAIVATVVGLAVVSVMLSMQPKPEKPLAAQSQLVTAGDCFFLNGQHSCPTTKALTTATTTVCSVKSPSATSTLDRARITFTVSSSSASFITIAKGTTPNASSTLLANTAIAANAQGTVVASSTPFAGTTLDGPMTVAPSTFVNFSMSGGVGTFSPSGTCETQFTY